MRDLQRDSSRYVTFHVHFAQTAIFVVVAVRGGSSWKYIIDGEIFCRDEYCVGATIERNGK